MSSNYHTPIAPGAPANAATFNTPMSDLDQAISDIVTGALSLDTLYSAADHDHDAAYAPVVHAHDERYFTEAETTAALAGKSDTGHSHPEYSGSGAGVPTGSIMPYAGVSEPSGWLFCYGQPVSRTTYAALYTALGNTYGAGNGTTTFNLPDLRGSFILPKDDMGGTPANRVTNSLADVVGGRGGAETHTLTIAEMPSHQHTRNTDGAYEQVFKSGGGLGAAGGGNSVPSYQYTGPQGGGGAHNNMPPYIAMNYIIKT